MADAAKTVSIIFEADIADARAKVDDLSAKLTQIGEASPAGLTNVSKAITDVGDSSKASAENTNVFSSALTGMAQAAGVPKEKVDDLNAAFGRLGVGPTAAAALSVAAIGAFAVVAVDAGREANNFKGAIENLTGSSSTAEQQFNFILNAVRLLETDLGKTADAFVRFTVNTQGTALSATAVQNAFIGIISAVQGINGSVPDAERVLSAFAKATEDGNISAKELYSLIQQIPGGLTIFANELGVSAEKLYEMARNSGLGVTEIERFAQALRNANQTNLSGISGAWNDLINVIKLVALEIGAEGSFGGAMWLAEQAIRSVTFVVSSLSAGLVFFGETLANVAFTLRSGDFSGFGDRLSESFARVEQLVALAGDKLFGTKIAADDANASIIRIGESGSTSANKVVAGADQSQAAMQNLEGGARSVDEIFKSLGLNPNKIKDDIATILLAFQELVNNPDVTGDKMLSALEGTLKRLRTEDDISAIATQWIIAFQQGKISADIYASGLGVLQSAQLGVAKATGETTPKIDAQAQALQKSEEAARKAEEAAAKFALELEKLASNERIKLIEAQVKLDIAKVEANAKIAVAAFDSITETVAATTKGLTDMLGILAGGTTDWASWRILVSEIEKQSARLDSQLALQKELLQAQIDLAKAKTQLINQGGALIQVDGAGLQPHLEAFMWEILRTIQTRVNADGLEMLTGI